MSSKALIVVAALALFSIMLLAPPAALAGETSCVGPTTGTFDDVVVPSGGNCHLMGARVQGSVKVMPGGGLVVSQSTIRGNVQAEEGHSYIGIRAQSLVGGSVVAIGTIASEPMFGMGNNYICASHVEGNIHVERSEMGARWAVGFGPPCMFGSRIDGNLTFLKNQAQVRIANNVMTGIFGERGVSGNLQLFDNVTGRTEPHLIQDNEIREDVQVFKNMGGVMISDNVIGGNLQCAENRPRAVAAGNVVGGNQQCED